MGAHLKLGGNEDGGGANQLQLVPHGPHLNQVVVHQLDRQIEGLVGELKVLLQVQRGVESSLPAGRQL